MMPSAIADRLYILVETRDRRPIAFVGREDELRYLQGGAWTSWSRRSPPKPRRSLFQ